MSNIGFQAVFNYLNNEENFLVSRFFHNYSDEKKLFSLDKHFNLNQYDIILLSQSFELDLFNFIEILIHNGINPDKNKRNRNDPFIGVGGIFPTMNPSIFLNIADVIFFGEIEPYSDFFIETINEIETKGKEHIINKVNDMFKLNLQSNNFIPIISNITETSIPAHSVIITNNTSFEDYFLIEISRGCKFNCSFCLVSNIYKDFRFYNKKMIISLVEKALKFTNKIGLISALTTEHPEIIEIVEEINNKGGIVNFSSLRADRIDDNMLKLLQKNNQNILTIAPETASDKIKKIFGKNILNDKIFSIIENSINYDIKKIKLYFIIGFEGETEADIEANINFIKKVRKTLLNKLSKNKVMPKIIVSLSPLVPKPHTEMSNTKMLDLKEIERRINYIKKNLLHIGGIELHIESPKMSKIQYIIANGNYEIGEQIIGIINRNGNIRHLLRDT